MDTKIVEKAINLWIQLTGANPEMQQKVFRINFFADPEDVGDYDVNNMNRVLKDAVAYDDSLVSFVSILRADAIAYARGIKYTLADMSDENSDVHRKSALYQELLRVLMPTDEEKERVDYLLRAMKDVGYESPLTLGMDAIARAFILAKKGIGGSLRVSQFTRGQYSNSGLRVFGGIYLCENVSEFVSALVHAPSNACVALAFLHNLKTPQSSYFAFGIKNGENVYLLSDKPSYPNPDYANRTRCPSRSVEANMARGCFPYSLVDFDLSNRYVVKDKITDGKRLVIRNSLDFPVLGKFRDMSENEIVYVLFMLSNIKQKFFEEHVSVDDLSYTFAQIDTPLLGSKALVPYSDDKILLPPISEVSDSDGLQFGFAAEENKKVAEHYMYLFERYKDRIPMDTLQPVGDGTVVPLGAQNVEMLALNDCDFYTKSELEYSQKWMFRENCASAIEALNRQEELAKHHDLQEWFEKSILSKKDEILLRAIRGELEGDFAGYLNTVYNNGTLIRFGGERSIVNGGLRVFDNDYFGVCFCSDYRGRCVSCLSDKPAFFFVQFRCGTWRDLCSVLGIARDELPEELRRYDYIHAPSHQGNSILDNIDPLACVTDKFNKMGFSVTFYFGRGELLKFVRENDGDVGAAKKLLALAKKGKDG